MEGEVSGEEEVTADGTAVVRRVGLSVLRVGEGRFEAGAVPGRRDLGRGEVAGVWVAFFFVFFFFFLVCRGGDAVVGMGCLGGGVAVVVVGGRVVVVEGVVVVRVVVVGDVVALAVVEGGGSVGGGTAAELGVVVGGVTGSSVVRFSNQDRYILIFGHTWRQK